MMSRIHELSASQMLEAMQSGELRSAEIVEALLTRADEVDDRVNGFAHRFTEEVLAEARLADDERARGQLRGPLHGLPISVKENIDTVGTPSTLGIRSRLSHRPARDAVVVRLARESGAIVIGKSNVPQTLLSPMECENHLFGATRNPWRLSHGPGGSSGGEAALLASGSSVLGVGTDLGGSIRFPASYCGVVGLKPTTDRWSNIGCNTALMGQEVIRAQIGPLGRRVEDVAVFLKALDSPRHAPFDPVVPPISMGDPAAVSVKGMRIGYYDDDQFVRPSATCMRAVRQAVQTLWAQGAELVEFAPPNQEEVVRLYVAAVSSDGMRTLHRALAGEQPVDALRLTWRLGRAPRAARWVASKVLRLLGEHRIAAVAEMSGAKPVETLWQLTARRTALRLEELDSWRAAGLSAVVCPSTVTAAVPIGMSKDFTLTFGYCGRYNVFGFPAGVLPVTRVREDETAGRVVGDRVDARAAAIEARAAGLPVGVQVVGLPFREDVVLAVMQAIQGGVEGNDEFPRTPIDPR